MAAVKCIFFRNIGFFTIRFCADKPTTAIVAVLATIGVYGIVALIVRMDDAGYKLMKYSKDKGLLAKLGALLVKSLPVIIRVLRVVGTIALLLVSGGVFGSALEENQDRAKSSRG